MLVNIIHNFLVFYADLIFLVSIEEKKQRLMYSDP